MSIKAPVNKLIKIGAVGGIIIISGLGAYWFWKQIGKNVWKDKEVTDRDLFSIENEQTIQENLISDNKDTNKEQNKGLFPNKSVTYDQLIVKLTSNN